MPGSLAALVDLLVSLRQALYYGQMTVGRETREVGPGDCVFIPTGVAHGLENTTTDLLRYLSAAAPAFRAEELDSFWPLPSEIDDSCGQS